MAGVLPLGSRGVRLEDTPGRRFGVCAAYPGTSEHDAMLLLDLTATPAAPAAPAPCGRER